MADDLISQPATPSDYALSPLRRNIVLSMALEGVLSEVQDQPGMYRKVRP